MINYIRRGEARPGMRGAENPLRSSGPSPWRTGAGRSKYKSSSLMRRFCHNFHDCQEHQKEVEERHRLHLNILGKLTTAAKNRTEKIVEKAGRSR